MKDSVKRALNLSLMKRNSTYSKDLQRLPILEETLREVCKAVPSMYTIMGDLGLAEKIEGD